MTFEVSEPGTVPSMLSSRHACLLAAPGVHSQFSSVATVPGAMLRPSQYAPPTTPRCCTFIPQQTAVQINCLCHGASSRQ